MSNPQLRALATRIRESESVLLHTGPGLLAETSLPTQDLKEAVWGDPDGRFSVDRFESEPEALWADWLDFWAETAVDPTAAQPQPVHERIAELVDEGHVSRTLTENVFGLLRQAGVPAERCVEFHGRVDRAWCRDCGRTESVSPTGAVGHRQCVSCLSTLGPGVVLAGEPPARADRLRAWAWAEQCDLYLVAGSNLTVHPTAENAERAVETGAGLVVIGDGTTALDRSVDERYEMDPAGTLARLRDTLAIM